MEKISETIKKGRQLMGLNQVELAQKVGVTKNSVWLWENEKKIPSGDVLLRVIETLDCVPVFFPSYVKKKEDLEKKIIDISQRLSTIEKKVK